VAAGSDERHLSDKVVSMNESEHKGIDQRMERKLMTLFIRNITSPPIVLKTYDIIQRN